MRKIEIKALLLALSITLVVTGIMIYIYYLKTNSPGNINGNDYKMEKVVIAISDISINSIIKDSDIKEISVPVQFMVANALTSKEQALDKVARENIYAGEQLVQNNILINKERDGLAAEIPDGYRAMTVQVNTTNNVANNVKTGDTVDILLFLKPPYVDRETVKTILQNVKIISTGIHGKVSEENEYLTFCLTLEDSEKLFLMEKAGELRILLRNQTDRVQAAFPIINIESLK